MYKSRGLFSPRVDIPFSQPHLELFITPLSCIKVPSLKISAHQVFSLLLIAAIMNRISKLNLVHRFEKRALLVAINCVAALSIFFFGYDQGVMGGVNTARSYVEIMGFGQWSDATKSVIIDKPTLQGGIVDIISPTMLLTLKILGRRVLFTRYSSRRLSRWLYW